MGLPSVLCIGAPRCGTTTLYQYLRSHPNICVSRPKEPNYFTANYTRGINWYKECFTSDANQGVDFSTSYSHYLNCPVVDRIIAALPRVRIIFLVRDPLDRLISNYQYNCVSLRYEHSFETAVYKDYLLVSSLYYFTLQRFLRRIPLNRMLLLRTELLCRNPKAALKSLCAFLNVEPFNPRVLIHSNSIHEVSLDAGVSVPRIEVARPLLERLWADLSYDWRKLQEITGVDIVDWENNPRWSQLGTRLQLPAPLPL